MEDLQIPVKQQTKNPFPQPTHTADSWSSGLVLLLIVLALTASIGGLFWEGLYRDSEKIQAAWFVNDLVTLIVVLPLMLGAWWQARQQRFTAGLLLNGLLVYLFYNYAFYLFGALFNAFFLLYVLLVAGSFYALALRLVNMDWMMLRQRTQRLPKVGWVSAFMVFIALPLLLAEGGMVLQATLSGKVPETPSVIFALDLTVVVPASLLAGILLWRRDTWGYLLAVLMSVKAFTYGIVLTVMTVYIPYALGGEMDPLLPFYLFVMLAGGLSLVYLLREPEKPWMAASKVARTLVLTLLFFNGLSATFGGWQLASDPSGASMEMPLSLLNGFFPDYRIPGLILGIVIGGGSWLVFALALSRQSRYGWWIALLGAALVFWIIVQLMIVQQFHVLQAVYGGIGGVLILLGLYLQRRTKPHITNET